MTELIDDLSATLPAPRNAFRIATQGPATIHADRGHFEEMLVNLVSNARRHSARKTASPSR